MELIDRKALEKHAYLATIGPYNVYVVPLKAVKAAPTIDAAQVVHASWIDQSSDGSLWACSKCGWLEEFPNDKPRRFCAGCGARMDADAPERGREDLHG